MSIARILKSERAAYAFAQRGIAAAEELLDAIRRRRHPAVGYLERVLFEVRAAELVELYAPLLDGDDLERSDDVFLGLRALGATRDPRAIPHLTRYIRAGRQWRDRAAAALAEIRHRDAIAPLDEYVMELLPKADARHMRLLADRCAREWEMRPLRALIAIAIGLARLGDHRLAFVPITLIEHEYPKRLDRIEQMAVRIEASHALRHVVGPGLLGAVAACVHGREIEAARNGAFAAFLVGTKRMVPVLVEAAKKRDHELRNNAPIWLHRLFEHDEDYEERTPRAFANWAAALPSIPRGVVFRRGKARDEREVVELLRGPLASEAYKELSITLGDLGASSLLEARDQPELYQRACAELRKPRVGALRRHGIEMPIPTS